MNAFALPPKTHLHLPFILSYDHLAKTLYILRGHNKENRRSLGHTFTQGKNVLPCLKVLPGDRRFPCCELVTCNQLKLSLSLILV